jgi:hypothetical protein
MRGTIPVGEYKIASPDMFLYHGSYILKVLIYVRKMGVMVGQPLLDQLYQPQMMIGECRAFGVVQIGKGNRSTRINSAPKSTTNPT